MHEGGMHSMRSTCLASAAGVPLVCGCECVKLVQLVFHLFRQILAIVPQVLPHARVCVQATTEIT